MSDENNPPLAQNPRGCRILGFYGLIILLLIGYGLWKLTKPWWVAQEEQIQQVQQFRTEFALKCVRQKGRTIQLSKASVSVMCIGPDGRILSSY